MSPYPHLAARLFNTPLLVHPGKLDAIIAGLGPRLLGVPAVAGADLAAVPEMFSTRRGERSDRGYAVIDGVARIHVGGALVHRTRIDADSNYLQGYNSIAQDVEHALDNPDVHALALVFDSPGGEVSGAFELADRLHALRGRKPMVSVIDDMAASAAYLAASATDEIAITATGYAGSIGVVARHVDFSQALQADGIKVTHIFAGAHKVDGNPYEPLPDSVRADFQADIDGLYEHFITAVATRRDLPPEAVRKTQAQTYRGVAAVAARLADRIGTTDQIISELAARRPAIHALSTGPSAQTPGDPSMTTLTDTGAQAPAAPDTTTTAAAPEPATQAALDAAHAAGVQAERQRTAAILALPAAATHTALAHQCVMTGLSEQQATDILAAAPAPAAPAAASADSHFVTAMAAMGNPDVSGIEGPSDALADAAALAAQVLGNAGLAARA